jgi:membrane protein YdbS with pleckstrin-like domain
MIKLDRKSIRVWNLESISSFLFIMVPILLFIIISATLLKGSIKILENSAITKLPYILLILCVVNLIINLIKDHLRYKNSGYQIENEVVCVKYKGLSSIETTIPYKRVQHVDIEQTFFSRLYNLYKVNIYTAGDTKIIHYLSKEEAELIKNEITKYLMEMSEEDNE